MVRTMVEVAQIKVIGTLSTPKPHSIDGVVAVAGNGTVVRHGYNLFSVHPLYSSVRVCHSTPCGFWRI